jgi:hypothetical protein
MGLHRPADDPAAERIEHDSEVQEAGRRRDICATSRASASSPSS